MERFAVIGLGRFGMRLARLLAESGAEVIAIDRHRECVEEIRDHVTMAVCMDSTDEQALRAQGIDKVDVAIVGVGSAFEASALTTVLLKQIGVPRVLVRAATKVRGHILSRIGADDIVNPERESAERWRNRLMAPSMPAPESFAGKTMKDLDVRRKYKVTVVAIRRTTRQTAEDGTQQTQHVVLTVPMPETVIESGDVLLLIGKNEAIQSFPVG